MANPGITNQVNTQVSSIENSLAMQEDEIDLNALFSKIWRRRKFIGSFVLFVLVMVVGMTALQYLMTAPIKNYSTHIRFNFPSSGQGIYPSGQRFSKNDLISTVVLNEVYKNNDIQNQGVNFTTFASSFSVTVFAENAKFIQQKYSQILSNKKLTRTEVEALEKQYTNELNVARANFAKISYVDTLHLGLSSTIVEKVLNDIPKVWSAISIRDLGVLDLKIPGQQFYQADLVAQYEYLQAAQYMTDSSNRFESILTTLRNDDLGGFVRDPKTDLVVSDLLARVQSINKFDLVPLFSVISSLGLVKNELKARIYITNQIERVSDQIAEIRQKTVVYKNAISSYAQSKDKGSKASGSSGLNPSSGMVQYGDGFLSKIVGMVEGQKDTQYRQGLLNQQIAYAVQEEGLRTKQEKLKRALSVLDNPSSVLKVNKPLRQEYVDKIGTINLELSNLVSVYQRILERRNAQAIGQKSALYEPASNQMLVSSELKAKLKKVIIVAAVSAFLALMIAVIVSLIVKEKNDVVST